MNKKLGVTDTLPQYYNTDGEMDKNNIPTRAISLMWNQRSVDTFLGLPFNIASYGLLLMMLANEVNMVPDELIGNLGDTHIYLNHIEQAKEQIGREPMELPTVHVRDGIFCSSVNDVIMMTEVIFMKVTINDFLGTKEFTPILFRITNHIVQKMS
jgi:thymidylate synthase